MNSNESLNDDPWRSTRRLFQELVLHAQFPRFSLPLAAEGVYPPPPSRNVEQFEPANQLRQRGPDNQMISVRFKAENHAQQQQRGA